MRVDDVQLVLRRPPLGNFDRRAHDVTREWRILSALASTQLPIPRVVAGCEGYARRQAQRWVRHWSERQQRSIPALDEAGRLLLTLSEKLLLDDATPTIVHGDYNLGNLIIASGHPPRLAAILDWEMATLGHPLMDLGLLVTYNSPLMGRIFERDDTVAALPGFPDTATIAEKYATRSGRSIELLDFFRVLALFKILVLIEEVRARHQAGTTQGDGYSTLGQSTPQNAEALLALIRDSQLCANAL